MDGIQGAILNVKLKKMNEWISKRRMVAELYNKLIDNSLLKSSEDEGNYHVYHIYSIFLKERAELQKYVLSNNINTGNHYPVPCICKNHTKFVKKNDFYLKRLQIEFPYQYIQK